MKVYPENDHNSWISEDDADTYFESRLQVSEWDSANKEVALQTAFRDLCLHLDLDIDLSNDDTPLPTLKVAQCEQALYLLKNEVDSRTVDSLSLTPTFFIKLGDRESRISPNAMTLLHPYIIARTIARTR
ncbi:MAG: hypothetical protein ACYSR1_01395 [Planctomycetota bacterium]|jgi:hypothetical protein